jgi:hypothetical protein
MARRNKNTLKPWASTTTSLSVIRIFVKAGMQNCYAYTESDGRTVVLSDRCFLDNDPAFLDETLMHEFIHCLEFQFADELRLKNPKQCTRQAMVFGRELPRMLRCLRRVAP